MPKCKACGKEIKFIETENGKKMPVDAEEVTIISKDGQVYNGEKLAIIHVGNGEIKAGHIPHWSTCSSPDQFRKGDK